MKKTIGLIAICFLMSGGFGAQAAEQNVGTPVGPQPPSSSPGNLKDEKAKLSYSVGMNVGNALKRQQLDTDLDALMRAVRDVLEGRETALTEEQAREILMNFQKEARNKATAEAHKTADANKEAGAAWLEENAKKEGVKTTPSGLQYEIVTEGTGPKPASTDTVMAHYRGTLIDGTEFDNSYKKGGPVAFPVTGVIKGWTEALEMMPVGSKWKLFIPSDLAYGPGGRPGIPPNSVLLFDIELAGIKDKTEEAKKP